MIGMKYHHKLAQSRLRQTLSNKKTAQSGQALLIAILISSVLLTIGLSLTRITNQETKIAKLQEDSSRARAAAEAGIDYLLDQEPVGQVKLENILPQNDDITGTAEIKTDTSTSFTTPLLSKDSQYTFYLTGYNATTHQVIADKFLDNIIINKTSPEDSSSCGANAFAVEITFINTANGIVTRRLIDRECDIIAGEANEADINFGDAIQTSGFSSHPHVMILRILAASNNFEGTKLRIEREGGESWAAQGRTFVSEAATGGKVIKKIQLFQSHPQFPVEFFVTTF